MTKINKKAWIASVAVGALLSGTPMSISAAPTHNKNVIGYLTQWEASKGVEAGYSTQGEATHLNVNLDIYSIINFSFFGVANDGSLHSADFRNPALYLAGEEQQPAPLLNTQQHSGWDLPILWGELEYLNYFPFNEVSDAVNMAKVKEQGFVKSGHGWLHQPSGITGHLPIPLKKEGGAPGLIDLAHRNGVKVMASIGGWSMSKHFPAMAADPVKKARFLADIDRLMALGFDGVDINWEFPGFGGLNFNGCVDDFDNFAQLMEDIRARIGADKLLSAAFSASTTKLEGFDWKRLDQSMNFFNMMTYNLDGGWSDVAGHNAPLYPYPEQESDALNLESLRAWLFERGIASEKINLGLAFYGRGVQTTAPKAFIGAPTAKRNISFAIDGPAYSAADVTNWPAHDGQPNYNEIVKATGWEHLWDANAEIPYAVKDQYILSYDNPESITKKVEYVLNHDLGGVIVWQVNGDIQCESTFVNYGNNLKQCTQLRSPLAEAIDKVFSFSGKNTQPVLNVPSVLTVGSGEALTFSVSATDVDNHSLEFTAVNAIINDHGNGTATISYSAPDTTDALTISISVIVSDGQASVSKSTLVNVLAKPSVPDVSEWDANKVYHGGDSVTYNGRNYTAQWWTQGEQPDSSSVWIEDSATEPDTIAKWKPSMAYSGGYKAEYRGDIYQAKWWTKGDKPDKAGSPWELIK
ncbi:glycosyl hydrolase family 18 protein [Photobacterium leiognathi]|uniref:glycosyl hydrolase family 18 protein n=1 Tax=Photobacterium leiognathi TaxID=553611 RepID=UPI002738BE96|nr:glycosyl hydrolase family 18 protein [Photobacterium leiognathi]